MENEHTSEQAANQTEQEVQGQQGVLRDQPEGEGYQRPQGEPDQQRTDNEQDQQTERTPKQQEGDESAESGA